MCMYVPLLSLSVLLSWLTRSYDGQKCLEGQLLTENLAVFPQVSKCVCCSSVCVGGLSLSGVQSNLLCINYTVSGHMSVYIDGR